MTDPILERWPRLLVLAPHADDETLGVGGTLARLARAGDGIRVLFLTGESARLGEASAALRALRDAGPVGPIAPPNGVYSISEGFPGGTEQRMFEDGEVDRVPLREVVRAIEFAIEAISPESVLLPAPSHHQDHVAVFRAGLAALRRRRLRSLGVYRVDGYSIPDVELPFPSSPSIVRLEERDLARKEAALRVYASQRERFDVAATIRRDRCLGDSVGAHGAERIDVVREVL